MKDVRDLSTPRPWEADDIYVIGRVRGGRPNGETIYSPYRHELPRDEQLANAALVATAVNAHDAALKLAAAVERITDWLRHGHLDMSGADCFDRRVDEALAEFRAAVTP